MFRISTIVILGLLLSSCAMVPVGPTRDEKASKINVQLGVGYYQQGNLELANEKLLKALDQDPESSQAHFAYAVLQHRFLHKEKAEEHFRKAIDLNPENSEALSNFGAFLCIYNRVE
jgi:type IV pilus assembly protein PilF